MSKKMSIARIHKLAEMYGPSVRFTPDGNEAVDGALEDSAKADLENNPEFDKVRQQAQQHEGNAKRARADADAATSQLTEANTENESLKAQLAEAKANAATGNVEELKESDYSDTDVAIVRTIKNLEKKLDAKSVEINNLKKKADDYETTNANDAAKAEQEAQYQGLLNDMDEDYGPQYRNAAVTAFDAKVKAGEVTGGAAKATRILEKCYKDAVKAVKDKEADIAKGKVTLDNGSGGGSGMNYGGVELQAGSLEDVTAQAGKILNKSG